MFFLNKKNDTLSFIDGFSGYNQIKLAEEDQTKTSFITQWGTFCYKVFPLCLKNAGATTQRAMTAIFHDLMGDLVEELMTSYEIIISKPAYPIEKIAERL